MPHSCIGALSHYHHSLVDYVMSDEAKRVLEATAAGAAVYHAIWKPFRPVLLSVAVVIIASISVTKVQIGDAALFAHRMRPCLYPPFIRLQSPEPVEGSPNRDARLHLEHGQAISQTGYPVTSFCSSPT